MIKFLHIGDVHLDSPFSGVDVMTSDNLKRGLRELFVRIIKSSTDCDFVLIPGDLFDCGYVTPDTLSSVRDAFAEFGKPVIIAPGNHDPYTSGSVWTSTAWSDNVLIFKDETLSSFAFEVDSTPVVVYGWAFTSDRLDHSPLPSGLSSTLDRGAINLICAHADTSSAISKYAPTPLSLFASSECYYAALAHIHNAPEVQTVGLTTVAYSSFPEGRSFDEQGDGSVLYVTVEEGRTPTVERRITSSHKYLVSHLDVTGADSDASVATLIAEHIAREGFDKTVSLKVYIEGSITPSYKPSVSEIALLVPMKAEALGASVCSLVIRDKTSAVFGAEHLASDLSIRGELYRTLLPKLSSADERERALANEALRIGLLALDGKSFT